MRKINCLLDDFYTNKVLIQDYRVYVKEDDILCIITIY